MNPLGKVNKIDIEANKGFCYDHPDHVCGNL